MTREKLKIEFGQPLNGWLPVDFRHGDFELQFTTSNIPNNPIDQLISSIRQITKGIASSFWCHQEPEGYFFDFIKVGNEYKVSIYFAKRETADKVLIYKIQGSYEEIVMPFYRSIKNFSTITIEELHWVKTNEKEIELLTKIVKGS